MTDTEISLPKVVRGQTVWCRTADGEWWKTYAAGPVSRSVGRPSWLAVPVLGWDHERPDAPPVNWPVSDVQTSDPSRVEATRTAIEELRTGDQRL